MYFRLTSAILVLALLPTVSSAQQPVGSEFQLNTFTTGAQSTPDAASDAIGNLVAVWDSFGQDGSAEGVYGQRYDASGNKLGNEFQINTYTTGGQLEPVVASDAAGNFVVAWESSGQDGSAEGIFGQRYDATGNKLGGEFQINSTTNLAQKRPAIASDADGSFVVVWDSFGQDGSAEGIFGQRYDAAGNKLDGEFQVNTYTTSIQDRPAVAMDADGNYVVVWDSLGQDGADDGVFGQRYDASGTKLGEEFQVNTNTPSNQHYATVASNADGDFVVIWDSLGQDGSRAGIFGQRYDASGNELGSEFQVNTFAIGTQNVSDIASDAEGNFVVTWGSDDQDGSQFGVFGQEYLADGTPRGSEFQVNTFTLGDQLRPAVAANSEGDFVIVWESAGQDGSGPGIFGQRFVGLGLYLAVSGTCPGQISVTVANAPPRSEVAVLGAANTNGWTKGGTLCPGVRFEVGEPLLLPPTFVLVDQNGNGSGSLTLPGNRCLVQALALDSCETSNTVEVP